VSTEDRLRDIQTITDAALSRLDDREFLDELLRRAKDVLHADTVAVLLLDAASGTLIATAAAGLEEEVRQGVRIPVGRGFAGRVAAGRRPVIIDHVDHTNVVNPILLNKGIQSLIGVPLIASGQALGVMHLGSLTARQFTSADAELLQLAADRAALAVQSMLTRDDRIAATSLQRSLVPSGLPAVAGAEMAARYIPGDRHSRRRLVRRVHPADRGAGPGDRRCRRFRAGRCCDHGADAQLAARLRPAKP
jgi:GAF domain-containing protein